MNFPETTTDENILDMIAYQLETVYDIAIYLMDNVSEKTDFESCLGVCNQLLKDKWF